MLNHFSIGTDMPYLDQYYYFTIKNQRPMKRLKLDDFKSKKLQQVDQQSTDKLLGQVLGHCHNNNHLAQDAL